MGQIYNSMEFPAVGYRNTDGTLSSYNAGREGDYWASVTYISDSNLAYRLFFSDRSLSESDFGKRGGHSVRCVRQ